MNELTGDGVMALFGAPIALEDAPQRAIRAGPGYPPGAGPTKPTASVKESQVYPFLRMQVGINTGPVVVGTLGNDLRVDFTVVGDTVNLPDGRISRARHYLRHRRDLQTHRGVLSF